MLKLNPTSGVDLDNAGDFLKMGANSIGLVAPLFPAGNLSPLTSTLTSPSPEPEPQPPLTLTLNLTRRRRRGRLGHHHGQRRQGHRQRQGRAQVNVEPRYVSSSRSLEPRGERRASGVGPREPPADGGYCCLAVLSVSHIVEN